MSERNKQVVRELWGAVPKRDFAKIAAVYDENVAYHGPAGEERQGRQAAVDVARMHRNAFPDLKGEIEQLVAEGDFVFARVRLTGTHKGELMGMAPTGNKVDLKWLMYMVRVRDGKIVEEWEIFDQIDFMKQLGMAG